MLTELREDRFFPVAGLPPAWEAVDNAPLQQWRAELCEAACDAPRDLPMEPSGR